MDKEKETTMEDVLEAIQQTLDVIKNRKEPIKMTPELLADIEKLKQAVQSFQEDTDEIFDLLEIDVKQMETEGSSKLRSEEKQLIARAHDIEEEACMIQLALAKAHSQKGKKESSGQTSGKQQTKERRKLFKSTGGDKKWLPL